MAKLVSPSYQHHIQISRAASKLTRGSVFIVQRKHIIQEQAHRGGTDARIYGDITFSTLLEELRNVSDLELAYQ